MSLLNSVVLGCCIREPLVDRCAPKPINLKLLCLILLLVLMLGCFSEFCQVCICRELLCNPGECLAFAQIDVGQLIDLTCHFTICLPTAGIFGVQTCFDNDVFFAVLTFPLQFRKLKSNILTPPVVWPLFGKVLRYWVEEMKKRYERLLFTVSLPQKWYVQAHAYDRHHLCVCKLCFQMEI